MPAYTGNNLDQFQSGVETFLNTLESTIDQVVYGQNLPLIGSALESVSDGAVDFVDEMRGAIAAELDGIANLTPQILEDALNNALGDGGLGWLDTIEVTEDADNLLFDLGISRELVELAGADLDLSLGETGLSLDVDGSAQVGVSFDWNLRLGLNTEGFYVDTSVEDELSISLEASVPDLEATATLGFLQMEATDNGSSVGLEFALDLQDSDDPGSQLSLAEVGNLSDTLGASLDGSATFDANLSTGTLLPALPSIGTNVALEWDFLNIDLGGEENAIQSVAPSVSFNSVSLDVGSFFGAFVGPIFEGISAALEPVQPLIDILQQELPILDSRIIDVAQELSEAGLGTFSPETLEFIDYVVRIAEIIDIINSISVDGSTITLGDFSVLGGEIEVLSEENPLANLAGVNEASSNFVSTLNDNVRFEFPLLSDPSSVVGLFLGQNTDIFRLDLPTIGFGVGYEVQIPIFGPINAILGGDLGTAANISFGLDSFGLSQFANGGFADPALISQGFFIGTPLDPGTPPSPIDEDEVFTFGLGTGVRAGAEIDFGVISGGVDAGLVAQLFLNLNGDAEGKVRFEDFAVPACLLEALGKLDAVVAAKLQIGFGAFSIRKRIELIRETLLDFRAGCSGSSEDHQQATVGDDGEAVLSVGDAAANLTDINGIEDDEVMTVTHLSGVAGDETITVEAYGASWTYEGVSSITANAGVGNDIIELVGVRSDAHLIGGTGDDELLGGQGNDLLEGEDDADYLSGGAGDDELLGGDGDDFLEGGAGDDLLDGGDGHDGVSYSGASGGVEIDLPSGVVTDGNGGEDTLISIEQIEGSEHNDTITGNNDADDVIDGLAGDDVINGGVGNDFLIGGAGADTIDGGAGNDATSYLESLAAVNIDLETGEVFSGGGSDADGDELYNMENVQGTQYDDEIRGNSADNFIHGAGGNDVLEGRGGADTLDGGAGTDTAEYIDSPEGVVVSLLADPGNLSQSVAGQGGHAEGDRLLMTLDDQGNPTDSNSIEHLTGSNFDDVLTGDGDRNILQGMAGDDVLNGGDGNDTLIGGAGADDHNGGGGIDWVDYSDSDAGVGVNLAFSFGFGGHAQGDDFSNVENIRGTSFADILVGDGENNDINPGLASVGPGLDFVNGGGNGDDRGDRLILDYSSITSSLRGGYNYETGDTDGGSFTGNLTFTNIERLHVVGSILNDSIQGGIHDDFVYSGGGDDTVFGGQGRNLILAGDGDDQVIHYNDAEGEIFYTVPTDEDVIVWMDGGTGIDRLSGNFAHSSEDMVLISLDPDTENPDQQLTLQNGSYIQRFEIFENIQTGAGADQITQRGRVNNRFETGAGDDVVDPGLGIDDVDGGYDGFSSGEHVIQGNDLLVLDFSEGDTGTGVQVDLNSTGLNAGLGGRYFRRTLTDPSELLDEVTFVNFERFNITGSSQNDQLVGANYADILAGNGGNDLLVGAFGNDSLSGGDDNDWVLGGGGDDVVQGDSGNDLVIGGDGDDTLDGGAGDDILIGIQFGETPFPADTEIDRMIGGPGADQFWLGDGLFTYYDDGNLFSPGNQNQAIITDFNPDEDGDVIQLHGNAGEYQLQVVGDSTRIFRNGFQPERIATIEGVTGLSLNSSAFQYVDDDADDDADDDSLVLIPPVFQASTATPQVALLLPAVQSATESARRTSSAPSPVGPNGLTVRSEAVVEGAEEKAIATPTPQPQPLTAQPSQVQLDLTPEATATLELNANQIATEENPFTITPQTNPYALLNTVMGDTTGLTINDVELTGDLRSFGTFQYDPFGLGNGIVLSTGKVIDLVGENQVDGGFVGDANIPLNFANIGTTGPFSTGIFRADLSDLHQIQSLTIADSGSGVGGAGGERSGFDLVGLKISDVLIEDAADINSIPGIDVFDFSPLSTFFTPGTQRPSNSQTIPESPDMFGTLHGQVNNAIATLSEFDFDGNSGFVSLGDGGEVGFDLTDTINPDGPLYLYVGEAANNGESLAGQITASAQRINAQDELSTDFGAPGAENDTTQLSFTFDADQTVDQVYFQFVFGSEEFPEFGGSDFNDAFSLKLNGLNLARLSDGATANINNLVPNPFGGYHPDFVYNPVGDGPASDQTPLDGFTQVLTFAGPVNQNGENELEITVKDIGDGWKDSAVFMRAGSFGTSETPKGGVTFFPRESTLLEGGSSQLQLSLDTVPTEKVVVILAPDQQLDLGQGAGKAIEVVFTPEDALSTRLIDFTAFDDTLVEGGHEGFVAATVTSADPSYQKIDVPTVQQFIVDNDRRREGDRLIGRSQGEPLVGAQIEELSGGRSLSSSSTPLFATTQVVAAQGTGTLEAIEPDFGPQPIFHKGFAENGRLHLGQFMGPLTLDHSGALSETGEVFLDSALGINTHLHHTAGVVS
ncbi:MAG: choice-of-anchor L domain-containing protein [Cyanobacteria bacterium P01_F01_bin.150]